MRSVTAARFGTFPTAAVVALWDTQQLQEYCRDELKLDPSALEVLESEGVTGSVLFGLDDAKLERDGMRRGAAGKLLTFIRIMRDGGKFRSVSNC